MSKRVEIIIHEIAEDGYPDMDKNNHDLVGRVAFIWDGHIVSGWPLHEVPTDHSTPHTGLWETADDTLSSVREFGGVTHWVEFPEPMWNYEMRSHARQRAERDSGTDQGVGHSDVATTQDLAREANTGSGNDDV